MEGGTCLPLFLDPFLHSTGLLHHQYANKVVIHYHQCCNKGVKESGNETRAQQSPEIW